MKSRGIIILALMGVVSVGGAKSFVHISENTIKKDTVMTENVVTQVDEKNNNFENYIKLIGLDKEKLISTLGEEPNSIDEGGLEFSKSGIRVWFKDYGVGPVQQVFINKDEVDFNGVKIGDKISSFKNVFGKPVNEDISSAYSNFEYNGVVLSVYYDSKTEITFAVYILDKNVK